MPPLQSDWPISINPFRHYVTIKGGNVQETGEQPLPETVAIVVPVRNGLKFFKLCFHSLLSFTDKPYMLHVVDHWGDLTTKKYFRAMHSNHQVYLHRFNEEFNFSAEVNLGLKAAFKFQQVKYGLILNADTVVEPFWLSKMISVMESHERIGIVGPLSNHAMHEQNDREKLHTVTGSQRVSGFCMLFRREVYEQNEGFDEKFTGGGFEDWDFCERARRKGWHIAIDGFTHIHHFYRQFRHHEFDTHMRDNEELFFKKHPLVHDLVRRGTLIKAGENNGVERTQSR